MTRAFRMAAGIVLLLAAAAASARGADAWPTKPIRIVAPYAPGGTADLLGRLAAQQLGEAFGQQVVVENKPGAGGVVGSELVARGAPDGYLLVVSGIGSHVLAPVLNPNVAFDPIRDFSHVALLGGPPGVLIVPHDSGARTLAAFIARAKASPLSYGSPGVGTNGHLIGALLQQRGGFRMTHVPYRGAAQAVGDVMAGQLPAASVTLTSAAEPIRARLLDALAVSAARRLTDFADLPTFAELGFPELVATTWFALSGPAGLPDDVVRRLNRAIVDALRKPAVRAVLARDAIDPAPLTPAELTQFIAAERARWAPLLRGSGAQPD